MAIIIRNPMSYQVLARKYRPATFAELEGQEHVLRALINALDRDRLHHAYLFAGTRGVGKTTIARILARCLNCETGVTSTPCGECGSCVEIGQGRSVDLIEIDAASRTGVDDMRDLLDNVQYMPAASRFKVYLIDEVHMLSKASFNAMLKTLEEPPEHVKFLFATTDPKKLPVTVLSRCLQFNLKNLSPERIVSYLKEILPRENVDYEESALWQLGRAADGSMRDALSLTDQAISYANNALTEDAVKSMLGSIDQQEVYQILDALIKQDGATLLEKVNSLAQFAPDYSALLDELLGVLHRVAVVQAVPEGLDNSQGDREQVLAVSRSIGQEDVQLFYQIGLIGKRDLAMAPDPRSGFEMILLRMLAFTPNATDAIGSDPGTNSSGNSRVTGLLSTLNEKAEPHKKTEVSQTNAVAPGPQVESRKNPARAALDAISGAQAAVQAISGNLHQDSRPSESVNKVPERSLATESSNGESLLAEPLQTEPLQAEPLQNETVQLVTTQKVAASDWNDILSQLDLSGVTQTLAANCTLESNEANHYRLRLNEHHASLWNKSHETRISRALGQHYNREIEVSIEVGETKTETPAQLDRRRQEDRQARAVIAIENDENIQRLIQEFGGTLNRDSIEPMGGEQQ